MVSRGQKRGSRKVLFAGRNFALLHYRSDGLCSYPMELSGDPTYDNDIGCYDNDIGCRCRMWDDAR